MSKSIDLPINAEGKGACDHKSEASLKEYSITVKPTLTEYKQKTLDNDLFLLEFYIKICNKYNMVRLVSIKEYDSKKLPHIHGTVLCYKMPFIREKGWSIVIKKKETSGWDDYLDKQFKQIRYEQEKIKKLYESSYQFIDNAHTSPFKLIF